METNKQNFESEPRDGRMAWTKPELSPLNLSRTETGDVHPTEITTAAGPS